MGKKNHILGKVLFLNVLHIAVTTGETAANALCCLEKKPTPDGHIVLRLQQEMTSELTSDI